MPAASSRRHTALSRRFASSPRHRRIHDHQSHRLRLMHTTENDLRNQIRIAPEPPPLLPLLLRLPDIDENVRHQLQKLRTHPWIPDSIPSAASSTMSPADGFVKSSTLKNYLLRAFREHREKICERRILCHFIWQAARSSLPLHSAPDFVRRCCRCVPTPCVTDAQAQAGS